MVKYVNERAKEKKRREQVSRTNIAQSALVMERIERKYWSNAPEGHDRKISANSCTFFLTE
jgi:hypothetical protein